jgi:hypothetical protein
MVRGEATIYAINESMPTITPTDAICVKKNNKVKKRKQKRQKN